MRDLKRAHPRESDIMFNFLPPKRPDRSPHHEFDRRVLLVIEGWGRIKKVFACFSTEMGRYVSFS
jgi:hypothetical protein